MFGVNAEYMTPGWRRRYATTSMRERRRRARV
jgi:hypothetical protein